MFPNYCNMCGALIPILRAIKIASQCATAAIRDQGASRASRNPSH
jgi:hypothetical protein